MPPCFSFTRLVLPIVVMAAVGLLVFWLTARDSADTLQSSIFSESASPTESTAHKTTAFDPTSQPDSIDSPSVRRLQDHEEWLRDLVGRLIALDDARSLVTAAAIMHAYAPVFRDPSMMRSDFTQRILDLMERATKRAPADPVVAILANAYCLRSTAVECDTEEFDRTLQTSDPDNVLAWASSLARANASGDRAQQERIIREMANANRVDTHYLDIESLLVGTIESVRVPIPESAAGDPISATRALAANALRSVPKLTLAPIGAVCKHPITDDLLASCQRVLESARDEQGNLPGVALRIAIELSRQGSVESQSLAETQRRRTWQIMRANSLARTPEQTQRIVGGDVDAAIEVLTVHGVPIEPPADWIP